MQKSSRDLATLFAAEFAKIEGVTEVEIAGPDLSICVSCPFMGAPNADIVKADAQYGRSQIGAGSHVNVEFVSANPTGPCMRACAWCGHW